MGEERNAVTGAWGKGKRYKGNKLKKNVKRLSGQRIRRGASKRKGKAEVVVAKSVEMGNVQIQLQKRERNELDLRLRAMGDCDTSMSQSLPSK